MTQQEINRLAATTPAAHARREQQAARVGQVWKSTDRREDRWVRVVEIDVQFAVVEPCGPEGEPHQKPRRTRVRLDPAGRLTRYRLVQDPPTAGTALTTLHALAEECEAHAQAWDQRHDPDGHAAAWDALHTLLTAAGAWVEHLATMSPDLAPAEADDIVTAVRRLAAHLTDQAARVVQVPYRRTTAGEDDHAA